MKHGVSPGSALFAMVRTFLVKVNNIKSYMNQDIFHFVNGCVLDPQRCRALTPFINPTFGIRQIRIAFPHTFCMCTSDNGTCDGNHSVCIDAYDFEKKFVKCVHLHVLACC